MLGINAKFYRNTGSRNSPTWVEITLISDLAVDPTWEEGDGSVRATPVKQFAKTQLALVINGKCRVDLTDAGYLALKAALLSTSSIDLLILDGLGTTNGVTGWRCDWHVFGGKEDQGLGNVLFMEFTLKPAVSSNLPQSAAVSGGVVVLTDFATP